MHDAQGRVTGVCQAWLPSTALLTASPSATPVMSAQPTRRLGRAPSRCHPLSPIFGLHCIARRTLPSPPQSDSDDPSGTSLKLLILTWPYRA